MASSSQEDLHPPICWARMGNGYKIINLDQTLFHQTMRHIYTLVIKDNVLCKAVHLNDDTISLGTYVKNTLVAMQSGNSLIAISESGEIVGILLMTTVPKLEFGRTTSRTIINQGKAFNAMAELKASLYRKLDIYLDFHCEVFARIYLLWVKEDYRRLSLDYYLMRTAFESLWMCNVNIVAAIFPDSYSQKLAKLLGFNVVVETYYESWRDHDGNEMFDMEFGEKSCCLMIARVPPPPSPPPEKFSSEKAKPEKKRDKKDKKKKK